MGWDGILQQKEDEVDFYKEGTASGGGIKTQEHISFLEDNGPSCLDCLLFVDSVKHRILCVETYTQLGMLSPSPLPTTTEESMSSPNAIVWEAGRLSCIALASRLIQRVPLLVVRFQSSFPDPETRLLI